MFHKAKVPRVVTGSRPLDEYFDALADRIEWLCGLTGREPVRVSAGASGPVVSVGRAVDVFTARLTGHAGGGLYDFVEVAEGSGGAYDVVPDGRSGQAYEFNLNGTVPTPRVVRAFYFHALAEYRFQSGSCT